MTNYVVKMKSSSDLLPWVLDSDYDSLVEALADIGSARVHLLITQEHEMTEDLTISQNITVEFLADGLVTTDGYTYTQYGPLIPTLHKIFNNTTTEDVQLEEGSTSVVYPQMFGAAGNDTKDDRFAIQCAVDCSTSIPIHFVEGTYQVHSAVVLKTYTHLKGENRTRSVIKVAPAVNCNAVETEDFANFESDYDYGPAVHSFRVENLGIDGNYGRNTTGYGLALHGYQYRLSGVKVFGAAQYGIYSNGERQQNQSFNSGTGVNLGSETYGRDTNCFIDDIQISRSGSNGLHFIGPGDSYFSRINCSVNSGYGVYFGTGYAGIDLEAGWIHSWSNAEANIYCDNASLRADYLELRDGQKEAGLFLTAGNFNITKVYASNNNRSGGDETTLTLHGNGQAGEVFVKGSGSAETLVLVSGNNWNVSALKLHGNSGTGTGLSVTGTGLNVGCLSAITFADGSPTIDVDAASTNCNFGSINLDGCDEVLVSGAYNSLANVRHISPTDTSATHLIRLVGAGNSLSGGSVNGANVGGVSLEGDRNTLSGFIERNSTGVGVTVSGDHCSVTGCTMSSTGAIGITITGDYNTISGNALDTITGDGIDNSGDYNLINDNVINDPTTIGIDNSGANCVISGNNIISSTVGVSSSGAGTAITSNLITSTSDDGIAVTSGNNHVISDNKLSGVTGTGIDVDTNTNLINSNHLATCSGDGINIAGNDNVINSNYVAACTGDEIDLNGDDNVINGNRLQGGAIDDNGVNNQATDNYTAA